LAAILENLVTWLVQVTGLSPTYLAISLVLIAHLGSQIVYNYLELQKKLPKEESLQIQAPPAIPPSIVRFLGKLDRQIEVLLSNQRKFEFVVSRKLEALENRAIVAGVERSFGPALNTGPGLTELSEATPPESSYEQSGNSQMSSNKKVPGSPLDGYALVPDPTSPTGFNITRTDIQSEPDKEDIETAFEQDYKVDTSDRRNKHSEEQSFDELIEGNESEALVLEESDEAPVDPLVVFAKELADASKKAGRTRRRDA